MKKILFVLAMVFSCLVSSAQHLEYDKVQTYETRAMSYLDFTSYTASDGTTIKIGDFVEFGQTQNSHYSYIWTIVPLTTPRQISNAYAGQKFEVVRITLNGKGQNKHIGIWTKCWIGGSHFLINCEPAIQSGELVGNGLTSDKALAELEKAKKKLDLGLITEDEYNQTKEELVKYIK